jgi:hypothetical protein
MVLQGFYVPRSKSVHCGIAKRPNFSRDVDGVLVEPETGLLNGDRATGVENALLHPQIHRIGILIEIWSFHLKEQAVNVVWFLFVVDRREERAHTTSAVSGEPKMGRDAHTVKLG